MPGRGAAVAVLGAYALALALIGFWPSPVNGGGLNDLLLRGLTALHTRGVPGWVGYEFVEWWSNVLLFVPLGTLVLLALGRHRWLLTLGVGVAVSITIETAQGLFLDARTASPDDITANAWGTLIGLLVAAALPRRRDDLASAVVRGHSSASLG